MTPFPWRPDGTWKGTMRSCPRIGPTSCNNERKEGCWLAIHVQFNIRCIGANIWTTQPSRDTQESGEQLLFLQDCPDLDFMVKKRRVGTHSCCAAVAPLCCRKGQMKVNKCARSTQISFTFRLFARPFYNQFFFFVFFFVQSLMRFEP